VVGQAQTTGRTRALEESAKNHTVLARRPYAARCGSVALVPANLPQVGVWDFGMAATCAMICGAARAGDAAGRSGLAQTTTAFAGAGRRCWTSYSVCAAVPALRLHSL